MTMLDFAERLAFSEGVELEDAVLARIVDGIPGATGIRRATELEDRSGTDYWIDRVALPPVSVDVKHRDFCPIQRFGSDDACIETTSVYVGPPGSPWHDAGRRKIGWTLDPTKRADLVVYTWPAETGRRFWVLYFPHLCRAARQHWREWARDYGERAAQNRGYVTLSVYPPRAVIAQAIRRITTGVA